MQSFTAIPLVALILSAVTPLRAADNALTGAEKAQGYILLFDGQDASPWVVKLSRRAAGSNDMHKPLPSTNVQDGAINPHNSGGGLVYTKERYANFVLSCDFKVSKGCNSGIFFRVGDPRDEVQNGFEIQVFDSAGKERVGKHDCGALYDVLAPSKNAAKPAGEWNHIDITATGAKVTVNLNGQQVIDADLDKYTEAQKNIDGSKNKYAKPLKDFPREGHIGLQDHGKDVWYKNIKLKVLK